MLAFATQRLLVRQRNDLSFLFVGNGGAVDPVNAVGVQHQLALPFRVIKHRHLAAANNGELLFFKGMKPAHKKWAFTPLWKSHVVRVVSTLRGCR